MYYLQLLSPGQCWACICNVISFPFTKYNIRQFLTLSVIEFKYKGHLVLATSVLSFHFYRYPVHCYLWPQTSPGGDYESVSLSFTQNSFHRASLFFFPVHFPTQNDYCYITSTLPPFLSFSISINAQTHTCDTGNNNVNLKTSDMIYDIAYHLSSRKCIYFQRRGAI